MARTKQTARKNSKDDNPNDAHRVQRAVAAANATSRARLLSLQRSWLVYCAQEAAEEQEEQQQQLEHPEQEQQQQEHQHLQGEQQQVQQEGQQQHASGEPQGETTTTIDIFGDLVNITNMGQVLPLVAQRTDIFNVASQVQEPWVEEQARLQAIEEEQEIQRRVFEQGRIDSQRAAEEENLRAAQQIQQLLEQRKPIKMRVKECSRRRKRSPMRLVPVAERQEQQQAARQEEEQEPERQVEEEQEAERRQNKRVKFRNDAPAWERRAPPPPPPRVKRKYRHRPGTTALREIRKYQKSCDLLIARAPFVRLVKEVMEIFSDRVDRIQGAAVGALQEASEDILTSLFHDSVLCHIHAKRVTLKPVDMALAMRLRTEDCIRK